MRLRTLVCALVCGAAVFGQQAWQAKEFPIGCWRGPSPAHNTLEHYQRVRDCNFNIVGPSGGYTPESHRTLLDLAAKAGLKAILVDGRISSQMVMRDDWKSLVTQIVADYASHPALYGYYLHDEPSSVLFDPLGKISREFERQDPTHLPYINLLPTYANNRQLGTPTYADHLQKFLQMSTPRVLSYDHYALLKKGGIRADYYENMELVQVASQRSGIPWWYVHNSGAYSGYRVPTEAEMRWQVYTSLAYGTKGIGYWYYWGRLQEDDDRTGVVDRDGKPTRLYHILQKLNGETQALGKVLLPLTWTGAWHVGEIPQGTRRLGGDGIVQLPADKPLFVGLFRAADGTQYAMIVNRDYAAPVEFEAGFLPHVVGVARISAKDGSAAALTSKTRTFTLGLGAGDGMLLRLTTKFDYPKPPKTLTAIDFQFNRRGDMEGWGGLAGLSAEKVAGGTLTMALGSRDPHISRSYLRVPAGSYQGLRVRMRVTSGMAQGQVFWTTSDEPAFSAMRHMNFPTVPDGTWQEYEIPLGKHARWTGKEIRGIRLDPSVGDAKPGAQVEIDWIVGIPAE